MADRPARYPFAVEPARYRFVMPALPPDASFLPDRSRRRAANRRRVAAVGSAAVLASGAATVVVGSAGIASADGFSVTTCADSGVGSLRAAVAGANAHDGADTITITVTCSGPGAVAVASPLEVTGANAADSLVIVGPGASDFVLDGGDGTRILHVDSPADFSLSGVTLQHADRGCTPDCNGGAAFIKALGDVVLDGVVFADNTVAGSAGAAMVMYSETLTISDSTFARNDTPFNAGALYIYDTGPVTISSSTFEGNSAGRDGGVITTYDQAHDVRIVNCTITGNTATGDGGAFHLHMYSATFSTVFSTVADNAAGGAGGGLFQADPALALTMVGSIFAGNTAGTAGTDEISAAAGVVVEHDNLFQGSVVGFTPDASDLTGVDPQLDPLSDNGGPTQTRALRAGSPAIDAGPTSFPPFPGDTSDQRGVPYVRAYGGRSDMGAFEVQPDPTPPGPGPAPEPEPTFTG